MNQIDKLVDGIFNKKSVASDALTGIVELFLILYAAQVAPQLPAYIKVLFNNFIFKILFFFAILYMAKHRPTIAMLLSIAFLLTVNYSTTGKFLENMSVMTPEQAMVNQQSAGTIITDQVMLPPVVIQPQVLDTGNGTATLAIPQVYVAELPIQDQNGNSQIVSANVTQMNPSNPMIGQGPGQGSAYQEECFKPRTIDYSLVKAETEDQGDLFFSPDFSSTLTGEDYSTFY